VLADNFYREVLTRWGRRGSLFCCVPRSRKRTKECTTLRRAGSERRRDGKNAENSTHPRSCKEALNRQQSGVLYKHSDKLYKTNRRKNNE
jgi:hypothetical protein